MRWDDFRRSDNVEDDRGGGYAGGGGFSLPGGGGLGIGTLIVLGLVGWATGIDPSILIGGAQIINGGSHYQQQSRPVNRRTGTPTDQTGQFVAAVLGNTEDTWGEIFQAGGQQYSVPRLRLYAGGEQGGCGFAQAAMGPFYCPNDRRIYLDTSFFRDMQVRFHGCSGKACEFAEAYVIAHEVGHHVQNSARHIAEGVVGAARRRQQGRGQPHPGAGRIASRLFCRGLGQSFQPALEIDRAGRRRGRAADGVGDRRRPPAKAGAGLCGAGRVYPWHFRAAPALVHHRAERRQGLDLRHVRGGFALRRPVMPGIDETRQFMPLRIAVLTVSDTRELADDKSGNTLVERIAAAGHTLAGRSIVKDEVAAIRQRVKQWIDDKSIDVIISTGGTGFTGRDVTPEAVEPLFEKRMDGFSTLFTMISMPKIGTSAIQTRATAGVANATYVFCLPGSPGACKDAWDEILVHQLDYRYRPCNFVEILPRLDEHLRRPKAKGATA